MTMTDPTPTTPTTTDSRLADLTRKITGLLDQAESTTNPHEADAFATKAMDLMAQYHIDSAMIEAEREAADPRALVEVETVLGSGPYVRARLHLLNSLAEAHDCRIVTNTRYRKVDGERYPKQVRLGHILGHRSDVRTVQVLYSSLLIQATRQAKASPVPRHLNALRYRRSFLFGFSQEIARRFAEARRRIVESAGHSTALVLANREDRVKDYLGDKYPRLGTLSSASPTDYHGTSAGREAGRSADLSANGSGKVSSTRPALGGSS